MILYLLAGPALAEDSLQYKTNFYTVTGASLREIHSSIQRSKPWRDKPRVTAFTVWHIDWNFKLRRVDGGCECSSFTTRTTITYTLPRWTPPPGVPLAVKEAWDTYSKALFEHESGHADLAREAAREIQARVRDVDAEPVCQAVEKRLNELARKIVEEYRKREKEYDQRTDHGAKQGASLLGTMRMNSIAD